MRRFTLHQFVQAGLVVPNPDKPSRPTNSPYFCYQIASEPLNVLRKHSSRSWNAALRKYLEKAGSLAKKYAQERDFKRIPLQFVNGRKITLTPGGQNEIVRKIIDEFCKNFTPGAYPLYVGDTAKKWAHFDEAYLLKLGVEVENHGKMPDVAVHYSKRTG